MLRKSNQKYKEKYFLKPGSELDTFILHCFHIQKSLFDEQIRFVTDCINKINMFFLLNDKKFNLNEIYCNQRKTLLNHLYEYKKFFQVEINRLSSFFKGEKPTIEILNKAMIHGSFIRAKQASSNLMFGFNQCRLNFEKKEDGDGQCMNHYFNNELTDENISYEQFINLMAQSIKNNHEYLLLLTSTAYFLFENQKIRMVFDTFVNEFNLSHAVSIEKKYINSLIKIKAIESLADKEPLSKDQYSFLNITHWHPLIYEINQMYSIKETAISNKFIYIENLLIHTLDDLLGNKLADRKNPQVFINLTIWNLFHAISKNNKQLLAIKHFINELSNHYQDGKNEQASLVDNFMLYLINWVKYTFLSYQSRYHYDHDHYIPTEKFNLCVNQLEYLWKNKMLQVFDYLVVIASLVDQGNDLSSLKKINLMNYINTNKDEQQKDSILPHRFKFFSDLCNHQELNKNNHFSGGSMNRFNNYKK